MALVYYIIILTFFINMNFKNLAMWAVIVFLTIGLYNMFKNTQGSTSKKQNIIFYLLHTAMM